MGTIIKPAPDNPVLAMPISIPQHMNMSQSEEEISKECKIEIIMWAKVGVFVKLCNRVIGRSD